MTQYVHFTEQQKRQASEVDLESFLTSRGEKLTASGRDKRLACNRSITIHENEWYDHATGQGGHSVSLAEFFFVLNKQSVVIKNTAVQNSASIIIISKLFTAL